MLVICINDDWKLGSLNSNVGIRGRSIYMIKGTFNDIPCPKKGEVVEVIKEEQCVGFIGYHLKEYQFPFPNDTIYRSTNFAIFDVNITEIEEILKEPIKELILLK